MTRDARLTLKTRRFPTRVGESPFPVPEIVRWIESESVRAVQERRARRVDGHRLDLVIYGNVEPGSSLMRVCEYCNAVLEDDEMFTHLMSHIQDQDRDQEGGPQEWNTETAEAVESFEVLVSEHPIFGALIYGNIARLGSLLAGDRQLAQLHGRARDLTLLHMAAGAGNLPAARLLMQAGAAIDARGERGMTPLHAAAFGGSLDMVIFLLDEGADFGAVMENGLKPTGAAKMSGHEHLASLLYMAEDIRKRKKHLNPGHSYRELSDDLKRRGY